MSGNLQPPIRIGERFARRVRFDADSIRRFATACGDFNPLHHDAAAAAAGPFRTLIASGPHVTAMMMGLDASYLSAHHEALGLGFEFRFEAAVPEGVELTLEWTITGADPKPSLAGHVVSVAGRAIDDAGTIFVTATGRNLLRNRVAASAAVPPTEDVPMTTNAALAFYFDYSSPYGYLASEKIEALAARHGRGVDWCPMLLGAAFKLSGAAPLTSIPLKGDYSRRDIVRSARFHGIPGLRMPSKFPIATQAPARITLWAKARDTASASRVAKTFYRAYFVDDRDISDPSVAADIAAEAGLDRELARSAIDDPAIKDALRRDVDAAIAAGVFGSPFVIVDGEPFWGLDRFDQIERWLATGGF